ncbi:uncharacterized protein G2W53_010384 [Senna tora]|uniref:Uncharacterized protein n=1 Tax=Senna tora TaxID=362788 RepID=A0A834X0L0_9FABA|nr:uncharacterized protein G2W53_010384 [Senna tora]
MAEEGVPDWAICLVLGIPEEVVSAECSGVEDELSMVEFMVPNTTVLRLDMEQLQNGKPIGLGFDTMKKSEFNSQKK